MITKSKLSVSIHDVEFSKDYQYMITSQFENQKKQTDVSALVKNPIFTNNTLIYDIPSPHTIQGYIIFVAHMLLPSEQNGLGNKQNTRFLGECSLELSPFGLQPTQTYNLPIRQMLKFVRSKQGKQITVGRFIASIKIVKEDNLPTHLQQLQVKRIQRNEYFVELPPFDPAHSFDWRIRVDIRQAINVPVTSSLLPRIRVDAGWTQYKDSAPEQNRLFSTAILQGPHPQWNQTILINNPLHINQPKGFLMISMRDQNNIQDLYRIYIPVESMACFVPYNIKFNKEIQESPTPMQLFLSVLLQAPLDAKDKLVDVIFQDITFQPSIGPFKQISIATVIDSQNEPKLQFLSFNSKQDSIQRILQFDQAQQFNYILSAVMKVPPIKSGNYKAAAVLTLSQVLLRRKINFYLVGKPSRAAYKISGLSQNVHKDLSNLLIQKSKKKLFLSMRNHGSAKFASCQLQIVGAPEKEELSQSKADRRGQETASEKFMKQLNFSSNESMLKHVAQNNEIIARILRQLDDKSQSLRQAAAQISDLRGRVKLLQNENGILRQQALRQQDELVNLVQREVQNMSLRDLKQKIVKISQLYKIERVKNRELERTVKTMQPQVSNTMQLNSIIVAQKNNIQTLTDKTQRMAKEHQRINVYKETIKKQEKVILKLETVMRDGMQEVRNARKLRVEYQELKKRDSVNIGSRTMSRGQDRDQIARLQGIISQLQSNNKGSSKAMDYGDGTSQYQLQFKLHQAQTRIASLQNQLQENARTYARQLAMLRMKIAQKEAVMNGYKN